MHCLRLPTVVLLLGAGMAPAATLPDRLLVTLQARALVAVDGIFGAPPGNPSHASGAVPSVDPRAVGDTNPPRAPTQLATSAPINGATVMLYSAQAAHFMNRQHKLSARTAGFAGVSSPRYISVNNAFGRPWIANAPHGLRGAGSEGVLDADGVPLAKRRTRCWGSMKCSRGDSKRAPTALASPDALCHTQNRPPSGRSSPQPIVAKALHENTSHSIDERLESTKAFRCHSSRIHTGGRGSVCRHRPMERCRRQ